MADTHILTADGIQLSLDGRKILSDVYLRLETGYVCGLLGRNGQGKTCLMNVIYGTLKAYYSCIRIDGVNLSSAYRHPSLLTFLPQFPFIPRQLRLKRIFSDFGLSYRAFADAFPEMKDHEIEPMARLSGGQQRLVETYVIVCSDARFTLLDEPFTHLTPLHAEGIAALIAAVKNRKGIMITDHLYPQVEGISDDMYVLTGGKTHLVKDIGDLENLGYVNGK